MIIEGIDPGLSGAACVFDAENLKVLDLLDMPTEAWGSKRHIDIKQLLGWTWRHRCDTCALERVQALPGMDAGGVRSRGMGAASAFRFGMCFGEIRGAMIAAGLSVVDVPPQVWKELFELNKREKDEARQLAIKLHPEAAHMLTRKKDQGRGECILIARWAALNRWENR